MCPRNETEDLCPNTHRRPWASGCAYAYACAHHQGRHPPYKHPYAHTTSRRSATSPVNPGMRDNCAPVLEHTRTFFLRGVWFPRELEPTPSRKGTPTDTHVQPYTTQHPRSIQGCATTTHTCSNTFPFFLVTLIFSRTSLSRNLPGMKHLPTHTYNQTQRNIPSQSRYARQLRSRARTHTYIQPRTRARPRPAHSHARTHARTRHFTALPPHGERHSRTHTDIHTYRYKYIYIYIYLIGLALRTAACRGSAYRARGVPRWWNHESRLGPRRTAVHPPSAALRGPPKGHDEER
jgi:hypothetical protein